MNDRPAGSYRVNKDGSLSVDGNDEAMAERHSLEKPGPSPFTGEGGGEGTSSERQPGSYVIDHKGQARMDEKDEAMQVRHGITKKRPVVPEPKGPQVAAGPETPKKGKGGK